MDQIRETETLNNLIESTKYTFEGGKMYYDENNIRDRRFAGFKKVKLQKGNQSTVKYFHQGDGDDAGLFERSDSLHLIGKVFKEELYGGSVKYSENYTTYGVYAYAGQIYKYQKENISTEFDTQGNKLSKAETYEYDLASRLPKKIINYGEVNFDINKNIITDIGEDKVTSVLISTTKRPQKFLSEEKFDVNGKFIDKTINFYDNLPFGYTEKGLLTESRNYKSPTKFIKTNFVYNQKGLQEKVIDHNGYTTTFDYDENNNPISSTNTLGQKTLTTLDKVTGAVLSKTDANENKIENTYDGFGNLKSVKATSPKSGNLELVLTSSINYGVGMIETKNIYADSQIYKTTENKYDSFGRSISVSETSSDNSYKTVDTKYNNLGQIVSVSFPYDKKSMLASWNPEIDTIFSYDDLGRVLNTKQGDNIINIEYFVLGKKVSDNTLEKHAKTYKYNTFGKVTQVTEEIAPYPQPLPLGGEKPKIKLETKYKWNILGNLINLEDAEGNVRNFNYDSEGKLLTQEDLHKKDDRSFGIYKYEYNEMGNLISKTDPAKNKFTYTYDNLYRPLNESNTELTTSYIYDNCLNGIGSLCQVSNQDYTQKLTYLKSGQISTETKNIDKESFTNSYLYNSLGQVEGITLPDTSKIKYTYDLNGKQKSVQVERLVDGKIVTTDIVNNAKYNIDGTTKEIVYGNNTKNCFNYSLNNGGKTAPRLSDLSVIKAEEICNGSTSSPQVSSPLYTQNLAYNLSGMIISNTEKYAGDKDSVINKFTYDELQRLTNTERIENGKSDISAYQYSSIGNLLAVNSKNYIYDNSDYKNPHAASLIGNTRMAYDLNGNVLDDGKNQYNWTKKNTLKISDSEKSRSEYTYDINGERIKEVVKVKKNKAQLNFQDKLSFVDIETGYSATEKVFVSKEAFVEIQKLFPTGTNINNDLIKDIVLSVYSSRFVSNTCFTFSGIDKDNCARETTLKAFFVKMQKEKNIALTFGALKEIWLIYKGLLFIPEDNVTTKKINIFNNATGTNIVESEKIEAYYNSFIKGIVNKEIENVIYISEASYDELAFLPSRWEGLGVGLNSKNKIDMLFAVANESKYIKNQCVASSDLSCMKIARLKFVAGFLFSKYQIKLSAKTLEEMYLVSKDKLSVFRNKEVYGKSVNQINDLTKVVTILADDVLNKEVYGVVEKGLDKNLYEYLYSEKKIASLFSNPKLISQESFKELLDLGITYTNLVIYDRLIDYSFAPYTACELIINSQEKYNCEKQIFVTYLYAIIKYEKDKEISPITLDEIFEAMRGNLTISNNVTEYKIREEKNYIFPNITTKSNSIYYTFGGPLYNSTWYDSYLNNFCRIGSGYRGIRFSYSCDASFNVPNELIARKNEIERAILQLTFSEGIRSTTSGTYTDLPYDSPTVSVLPIISNNQVTFVTDDSFLNNFNTDPSLQSNSLKIDAGAVNSFEVTKLTQAFVKGAAQNFGIRIVGNGSNSIVNIGNLKIYYAKDVDQVLRATYTPLFINPKYIEIENNVLKVLSRIDREVIVATTTIISKATFDELKNTTIKTNDDVKNLFNQNEKLQKDETLSAVWNKIKSDNIATISTTTILTREALEELFMVWQGKLSMPVDDEQYDYNKVDSIKYVYDKKDWTAYSVNVSVEKDVCTFASAGWFGYVANGYCFIQPKKPTNKSYVKITKAKLTFTNPQRQSYTSTITVDAPKEVLIEGTNQTALKLVGKPINYPWEKWYSNNLSLDLTDIYLNLQSEKLENNGLLFSTNYGMLSILNKDSYIEYEIAPNFQVFDRATLTNLSVVPGMKSLRDIYVVEEPMVVLANENKLTSNIQYTIKEEEIKIISDETLAELKLAGIIATANQIPGIL